MLLSLLYVLPVAAFVPSVHRMRSSTDALHTQSLARSAARMQTLAPPPTITKPDALPETWVVPDTFTFPSKLSAEPPFYKVTLFKSSTYDSEYIAGLSSRLWAWRIT